MPIERGSTRHGPRVDDQMSREVQGRVQGVESPRAQEWHEPEPAAEDQPQPDRLPHEGHTAPGSPKGMTSRDVVGRAHLATYLPHRAFPGDRSRLLDAASGEHAPDEVIAELARLPEGATYRTLGEVWAALGHGHEDDSHRA